MNNPCRFCTQRNINCHSTCNQYKSFKYELEKIKNRRRYEDEYLIYKKVKHKSSQT